MSADQQKVVGRFLVLWTVAMCPLGAGIASVGDALSATSGATAPVALIGLGGIVAAVALWVLQREPSAPPALACAYCGEDADGEFSVHRDGFGEGPEVPLCREHGASPSPCAPEADRRPPVGLVRRQGTVRGGERRLQPPLRGTASLRPGGVLSRGGRLETPYPPAMTITLEEFRKRWGEDFPFGYGPVAEAAEGADGIPGSEAKVPWELDDVAEVIACDEGGWTWDGHPWIALLRFTDGRFVFMVAKCDNYWWDVAEGYSFVGDTLPAVVFFGTTEEDRARLKIANSTSPAG